MLADAPRTNWNEIQFLSWKEFRQMAPTILQLEVRRIGGLLDAPGIDAEFRNALVRVRFELGQFIACVQKSEKDTVGTRCAKHLRAAIVTFPALREGIDDAAQETCRYILDRLMYVNDRVPLIY